MADGWSELGAALAGGNPIQQQQAFQTGMLRGAQAQDVLAQARLRRDQEMARQQINGPALAAVLGGIDPNTDQAYNPSTMANLQGNLVSAMFKSGIDPRQLSGYQNQAQGNSFKQQAWNAATAANPDVNQLNRELMVISGKPVDLSKVEGNVTLNPMQTPDSQTINPTQIGLADIMLKGAQAGAANASAAERKAQAARAYAGINADKAANYELLETPSGVMRANKLTGQSMPLVDANGKPVYKINPGDLTPKPPSADLERAAFGADSMTGQISSDDLARLAAYQQQQAAVDPRFNNGNFALSQYLLNKPIGSHLTDPAPTKDSNGKIIPPPPLPSLADRFLASLPTGTLNNSPSTGVDEDVAPTAAIPSVAPAAALPATSGAPMTAMPSSPLAAPSLPQPKSKADYDALPAGAQYIYTDGSIRVKGG